MTQLVVETVLVIIATALLMSLRSRKLPGEMSRPRFNARRIAASAALASVLTLAFLAALEGYQDTALAAYFSAHSVPDAHGRNVTNVILVDFRGFDTFGEIFVLVLALLALWPVLSALRGKLEGTLNQPNDILLRVVARPLYWVILVVAAAVLLRGHNSPGGGFIGGLIAVTGSALIAAAFGAQEAVRLLPFRSLTRLSAAGVLIAALSGIPGWVASGTFLTHAWWTFGSAGFSLDLSTVYLFDTGVFLAVWGALAGYAIPLIALNEGGAP